MKVLFYLIVACFTIWLVIFIFKKITPFFIGLLGVLLVIIFGTPLLLGISLEKISRVDNKIQVSIGILLSIISFTIFGLISVAGFYGYSDGNLNFDLLKYILPAPLFAVTIILFLKRIYTEKKLGVNGILNNQNEKYFILYFTAFFLILLSLFFPEIFKQFELSKSASFYASWLYCGSGIIILFTLSLLEIERKKLIIFTNNIIKKDLKINTTELLFQLKNKFRISNTDNEIVFYYFSEKFIKESIIIDILLNGNIWFFNSAWIKINYNDLAYKFQINIKNDIDLIESELFKAFELPKQEITDLRRSWLDFGEYYNFNDGKYFVSNLNSSKISVCFCCGWTSLNTNNINFGDWYCSSICRETESICEVITKKPAHEFLSDAAISGLVVMTSANAWSRNQKLFSVGGQGHGFAAEEGNNMIDRLMLKEAKVVGGDNSKHGADRSVNGVSLQTKYCATGQRSVGAGFEGQAGNYKYFDRAGNPMRLEVPRDQYDDALRTMSKKILEGKVPGVIDPKDAKNLITKGHLTYSQARNISKFGTYESLTYDAGEGVVIGLSAGGISFCISSMIYYINTKDPKEALRIGVIQGGKAFGKSLTIYVATQQLHRVETVQQLLQGVNVSSPTITNALSKGMGVSKSQVNNVLKGTIVTSVVIVAITTGPDLIKLIRGRISGAQFVKNLSVVTSSVIGGAAGAMAGGLALSPLGPIGVIVGKAAGGMAGGMAFAAISNMIGNSLIEEDRVKMLQIVQNQIEFLAISFLLTGDEIDNLNKNLELILKPESLEILHASENRISVANFFLKPVVVSIVKQRPKFHFTISDILEVTEELVA